MHKEDSVSSYPTNLLPVLSSLQDDYCHLGEQHTMDFLLILEHLLLSYLLDNEGNIIIIIMINYTHTHTHTYIYIYFFFFFFLSLDLD